MEKIVVSNTELETVEVAADVLEPAKVPRPIPMWARLVMLPLVLVLPLLAVFALVLRIALRATAPRTQQAWHSYLNGLLIASAFVFTLTAVLTFSYFPTPPQAISSGLSELDERADFPTLPAVDRMTGVEIAEKLKPLVMVATPTTKRWFTRGTVSSNYIGAAMLLQANAEGYLFATARHVAAGGAGVGKSFNRVLLTEGVGGWAGADVVAWSKDADVALLWMPRHSGKSEFVQPLADSKSVLTGSTIYVIGHPEGLNFTVSNGIISRMAGDMIQVSAPVSPGNSGGPVYDEHGSLIGIVSSKLDRNVDPNAENLSFAVNASVLRRDSGWEFSSDGHKRLTSYINALNTSGNPKQ